MAGLLSPNHLEVMETVLLRKMGHKDLLVTHTLYRQRDYSEAHDAASAAPAASF
jgi:hypothetical protein